MNRVNKTQELGSFIDYLKAKQLHSSTVKEHENNLNFFFHWIKETGREEKGITYIDLLNFIDYNQKKKVSKRQINRRICAVRYYYNYLKSKNKVKENPASGLYIKGIKRRLPHHLLTEEQLTTIYQTPKLKLLDKVILGLMIYQGLRPEELTNIKLKDINTREGKLTIQKTSGSNQRTLKLESHQIIDLHEYILIERKENPKHQSEKLLLGKQHYLISTISNLSKKLKGEYTHYYYPKQFRGSRITLWLKIKGIREVQYMAGHKYVSSTERYQRTNLEELQRELLKHHPQE